MTGDGLDVLPSTLYSLSMKGVAHLRVLDQGTRRAAWRRDDASVISQVTMKRGKGEGYAKR